MATAAFCVAASSQPCRIVRKRTQAGRSPGPDSSCVLNTRHLPEADPDRFSKPAGVLFPTPDDSRCGKQPSWLAAHRRSCEFPMFHQSSSLRAIPVLGLLVLTLSLSAGCAFSIPSSAPPPEATPELPLPVKSQTPCWSPSVDVEIVHAAWTYVHERYPAQPWPDDVYLIGDRNITPPCQNQPIHVALCSHATGFVWEGDIVWNQGCACCRMQVEAIRELYVAMPGGEAVPTMHP
jgi:hypothetical protein